ncbi:multidrug ABC transporter ATP-binding protein [Pseudoroseomonas rhizosphaerae]|uniref:Multidrug ABC transporter ATP-binding protein n=1 Tax=Teichococcus rhizosphaerae TaxID=1335062 RepID=A0A2C6Z6F0_9PROT|nr:ABC transporter ATP-binding protein [Pseudoroseomonas rhizosphaerae]PHK94071.1 multidrug ABC transporter ATP-binding protein [Pseudoroseomonas rhizosphaerae]
MTKHDQPAAAIEVEGLQKVYPGTNGRAAKHALKGVNLVIPRGSIFGLLGPNGAGKSTLINILAGLVRKSAGTARVWGIDIDEAPRAARAAIGVVPQELTLDPYFPARAALELQAGLFGIPKAARRTDELLEVLGLADKATAPARSLSGGMRRRLMVGKALVHSPPVLVLDEPTAGVDVALRQQLWDYVRLLNRQGTTVLLTTHYLQEAEALCDQIAVMADGQIVAHDTTDALFRRVEDQELVVDVSAPLGAIPDKLLPFNPTLAAPQRLVFRFAQASGNVDEMLGAIRVAGLQIASVTTKQPDLEDVFLQLVQGPASNGEGMTG